MKNPVVRILVSVLVSVLILWFLLRLIGDESNPIGFADLGRILVDIPAGMYMTFLCIHLVGVVIRTARFRILIGAAQSGPTPGFFPLTLITLVRNMTVDMLPSRIGELFYVGLLNRGLKVPMETCFSSLAISVWFDVMVIIPLVLGLVLYPLLEAGIQQQLLVLAAVLVVICTIGILILHPGLSLAARMLQRISPSRSGILGKLNAFVSGFASSVKGSLGWRTILQTFLLTVGVRFCKYSSIAILFYAIARAGFPELANADPGSVVIALLASEAGASLPVPTFMSFGTYEAGGLAAFAMLGISVSAAGLALFTIHLVTQTVDYTLGGLSFIAFVALTGVKPGVTGYTRPIDAGRPPDRADTS